MEPFTLETIETEESLLKLAPLIKPPIMVLAQEENDVSKINTKSETFAKVGNKKPASVGGNSAPKNVAIVAPVQFRTFKELPKVTRGSRKSKFNLESFKPGQCFDLPKKSLNTVLAWGKRHGLTYASRTTDETPAGMVSVYYPKE